ncbi:MAG: tandem-95 repeat protein [Rhodospirillales bacterium]|nr:tandem-95 repeat protein [Rhodospirillales bacterium]
METPIALNTGQEIWFDVFFDAADAAPANELGQTFTDFAVFTASVNGRTSVSAIAEETPQIARFGATGWQTIKYTAGTSGEYTFGFAVINDALGGASRLYVDNVRFQNTLTFPLRDLASQRDGLGGTLQILVPRPIANDDVITVTADRPVSINVATQLLANDRDPDTFDGWRVIGIDQSASQGRVSLSSGQPIVYDPNGAYDALALGQNGIDTFRYTVDGGNGERAEATVTLIVRGVNDAPIARPDGVAAQEDGAPVAVDVLTNDDDIDTDDNASTLRLVSVAGEGATLQGRLVMYDPGDRLQSLGVGETTSQSIAYTVADRHGSLSTGELIVTVSGANDIPVAERDSGMTDQNTQVALGLTDNDSDVDRNDSLRVVMINGQPLSADNVVSLASGALVSLSTDGRLLFDPNGAYNQLPTGQSATTSFAYTVTDDQGGFADAEVTLTVIGLNDAPVATADLLDASEKGVTVYDAGQLIANDIEPDLGDQLRLIAINGEGARIEGAGIVFDPGLRFQSLSFGATTTQQFTYTVADLAGATAEGEISITIRGVNDAPIANDDSIETIEESDPASIAVLANDVDPDAGDELRVIAIDGSSIEPGGRVTLTSGSTITLQEDGTLAYDPGGAFDFLAFQQRTEEAFTYTVTDPHGGIASARVVLGISGVNDAPEAVDDVIGVITQNEMFTLNVLANDSDPDSTDFLRVVQVNGRDVRFDSQLFLQENDTALSDWVVVRENGDLTYNAGNRFNFLSAGESTQVTITYTIRDLLDARDTGNLAFEVTGINDAPEAVDDDGYGVDSATVLEFPGVGGVLSNDRDPDRFDFIRVSAVEGSAANVGREIELSSGALLTLNADGSFRYDPNEAFDSLRPSEIAFDTFSYSVSDEAGASDQATVTIQVQAEPNQPPTAVADEAMTDSDAAVRINVLANDRDPENANLKIIEVDPEHAAFVRINPDGTLTYDPSGRYDALAVGETTTDTFTYTVDDDLGGRARAQVTVTIVGTGTPALTAETIVESFEQPYGSLVTGWGIAPNIPDDDRPIRLGSTFSAFGQDLSGFAPTHFGNAVELRGEGIGIEPGQSRLETYLGLPATGLPNDLITPSDSHSGQTGDGSRCKFRKRHQYQSVFDGGGPGLRRSVDRFLRLELCFGREYYPQPTRCQ